MTRRDYDIESIRVAGTDEDAEWQRVNTYVADILKDCYVLFAKLARVRGDFAGKELSKLDSISNGIREIGQQLTSFSKAFTEGQYTMNRREQFGDLGPSGGPGGSSPEVEDFDFSEEDEFKEEPEEGSDKGSEPEEFEEVEEEEDKDEKKKSDKSKD
jgi:hypothetical protein